jgi:hypothetical protein
VAGTTPGEIVSVKLQQHLSRSRNCLALQACRVHTTEDANAWTIPKMPPERARGKLRAKLADRQRRWQPSRAELIRLIAAMAEADESLSGVTLILPSGSMEYVSALPFRRGGGRA